MPFLALILSLAASAALPAQTGDQNRWIPVAEAEQGAIFIDRTTITRNGPRAAAWFRTDLRVPGERGEAVWMDHREFDCDAREIRLLAWRELRPDGSEAAANPTVDMPARPVEPGTIGQAGYDILCRR